MVETDETDDDWLSQQPVTAVGYAVTCQGIGNPAIEDQLVTNVRTIVDIFSQAVDLSGLDGITIAADYPKALATLDRGYETDHVLTPTTEGATGVAMSPLVKRNGVLKTHIVLNAALMLALLDTAAAYHSIARMTLVHECVHVYEHTSFNKAFPGFLLQKKYTDVREWLVIETARACWAEYLACRFSTWSHPEQLQLYDEVFCSALGDCSASVEAAFAKYHVDREAMNLAIAVGRAYSFLLKYGAYLVGHLAGIEQDITGATGAAALLTNHSFAPFLAKLDAALAKIAANRDAWRSIDEIWTPGEILIEILATHGIYFVPTGHGQSGVIVSQP